MQEKKVYEALDDHFINIVSFPEIDRTNIIKILKDKPLTNSDGREFSKIFQWHKTYIFHPKVLSMYDKILYIDAGMNIFNRLQPILDIDPSNFLLAHSDAYPYYERKLKDQFESTNYFDLFNKLCSEYKLDIDYFQSGILLFNTNVIPKEAFDKIIELSNEFLNTLTNEQAIFNLYFNSNLQIWRQFPIYLPNKYTYDCHEREYLTKNKYIMLKCPKKFVLIKKLINPFKKFVLIKKIMNMFKKLI